MRKHLKKILIFIVVLLTVATCGFFIWASQYYPAEEIAIEILDNDNVKVIDEYTIISSNNDSDIGIIFYPGAKVEAIAYLPILDKLSEKGYT